MDEQADLIMKNAEELKEKLVLLVEETGAYKASKEQLAESQKGINDLIAETTLLFNSIKILSDELEKIDFSVIGKINGQVGKIKSKIDELGTVISSIKSTTDESRTLICENAAHLTKIENDIGKLSVECSEIKKEVISKLEEIQTKNMKIFIIGISCLSLIILLVVLGFFI